MSQSIHVYGILMGESITNNFDSIIVHKAHIATTSTKDSAFNFLYLNKNNMYILKSVM